MELPGPSKSPAYAVAFNHADPAHADLFAVVRGPTLFIVRAEDGGGLAVVQAHAVPPPPPVDASAPAPPLTGGGASGGASKARRAPMESSGDGGGGGGGDAAAPPRFTPFSPAPRPPTGAAPPTKAAAAAAGEPEELFCVAFTVSAVTGHLLAATGGKAGILRLFDLALGRNVWAARGHGGAINDVAASPARPSLVLTASKDASLRLWHVDARACLALAAGDGAHRAEVVSCDFHPGLAGGAWGEGGVSGAGGGGGPASASGPARAAPPTQSLMTLKPDAIRGRTR